MPLRRFTLFLFCLLTAVSFGVDLRETVSGDRQFCQAYLKLPETGTATSLIFYVLGSGFQAASEPLHPIAKYLFHKNQVAVLTIEKPGIKKVDKRWTTDVASYQEHTPDDLMKCAFNALEFADKNTASVSSIFFLGHSEGAEVLLRTYDELEKKSPALAKKVKAFQLTSAHLGGWQDLADFQLKEEKAKTAFQVALQQEDELYFQQNGAIPLGYWQQALKLPPASTLVKELAKKPLSIHFYQGRLDKQISPKALEELEKWAAETPARRKQFKFHWFNADHALEEAQSSVIPLMIDDASSML